MSIKNNDTNEKKTGAKVNEVSEEMLETVSGGNYIGAGIGSGYIGKVDLIETTDGARPHGGFEFGPKLPPFVKKQ